MTYRMKKTPIIQVETIGMGKKKGAAFAEAFKRKLAEDVLKIIERPATTKKRKGKAT